MEAEWAELDVKLEYHEWDGMHERIREIRSELGDKYHFSDDILDDIESALLDCAGLAEREKCRVLGLECVFEIRPLVTLRVEACVHRTD